VGVSGIAFFKGWLSITVGRSSLTSYDVIMYADFAMKPLW